MELVKKHYGTALYVVGGLISLFIVIKIGQLSGANPEDVDALNDSTAGLGVKFVMPLLWIALILTVGFSLYKIALNKVTLIRSAIAIALLGLVFAVTYSSATDDVSSISTKVDYTGGELQLVGALVKSLIVLVCAAVGLLIVAEVRKAVKNG